MLWLFLILILLVLIAPVILVLALTKDDDRVLRPMRKDEIDNYYEKPRSKRK